MSSTPATWPPNPRPNSTCSRRAFGKRTKREDERFRLAADSEYWFALCFKTREDKDAFLAAARMLPIGDKYLDGYAVARVLGIPMPTDQPAEGRSKPLRNRFARAVAGVRRAFSRRASSSGRGRTSGT